MVLGGTHYNFLALVLHIEFVFERALILSLQLILVVEATFTRIGQPLHIYFAHRGGLLKILYNLLIVFMVFLQKHAMFVLGIKQATFHSSLLYQLLHRNIGCFYGV